MTDLFQWCCKHFVQVPGYVDTTAMSFSQGLEQGDIDPCGVLCNFREELLTSIHA